MSDDPISRMRKAAAEAAALYDRNQFRDADKQRKVAGEWALVAIAEALATPPEPAATPHDLQHDTCSVANEDVVLARTGRAIFGNASDPHQFVGRLDRGCEKCGQADRAMIHDLATGTPREENDG